MSQHPSTSAFDFSNMSEKPSQPSTPSQDRPTIGARLRTYLPNLPEREAAWAWLRWFLIRAATTVGAFVVMLVLLTGAAGWYTSRSEFCRSCHIMEPYYVSWQESSHANVPCIECHFPPGVGGKVRGKMLGLVQLAKYFTASEGPRPAAEIPDASCLRSGCHDTRLLSGQVDFDGVPFDHRPHLEDTRRGKKLRCTSCHSQIVQGVHMTVTKSTCHLCHFKDQPFNEGLGACTRCHQIPQQEFDLGGGVKFTHELAYERGIDCVNCHGDVIRGKGEVPEERCRVCHNRPTDLAKINDHVFMHEKHVTEHKIDCTDCHLEIKHSLEKDKLVRIAADCQSCHPQHHHEQLEMFAGTGSLTLTGQSGGMMMSRVGCRSCHQSQEVSATGTVLWKASAQVCAMCHEPEAMQHLETYHQDLKASFDAIEAAMRSVREALEAASLDEKESGELRAELAKVEHDLNFLREGNALHNIHYAGQLAQTLADRLREMSRRLKLPEPKIELPEAAEAWK